QVDLFLQLILRFDDGPVRGAESEESDLRIFCIFDDRFGNGRPGGIELLRQAIHVVLVIIGALGIDRPLVMTAASRKERRSRMWRAGQRAIADSIAIDVGVTLKATDLLKILRGQDLAAIELL